MKMNFLKYFRFPGKKTNDPYSPEEVLHLWEDDYLMLELLPVENLDFIKAETKRLYDFARTHISLPGYNDVTPINESPVKTITKGILLVEVNNLMIKSGLQKVDKFHLQDVGILQGEHAPLGYGTYKYAIMCDKQESILKNIWLTGHPNNEEEKEKLTNALLLFGQTYNFVAVDWRCGEYFNLNERSSIEDFI